ncbi:MAG: LamG domain-containing protein [Deltaproteobacteria bacterium]|nr:LamG domain-containing protein [Deltaproteobacteria bacterium]
MLCPTLVLVLASTLFALDFDPLDRALRIADSYDFGDTTVCNGRLTLTSGTAVTTSDVTAATTVYFAPMGGSKISVIKGYRNQILADSPIGYWRLGESSGTTATDLSGSAHDGTYTNTPTLAQTGVLTGDSNTSVSFSAASSQYVDIGTSNDYTNTGVISLEAWFKTTDRTVPQFIMGHGNGTSDYVLSVGYTTKKVQFWTNGGGPSVSSTTDISNDTWYHVVAVRTGSTGDWTFKIYLNGILDATATSTTSEPGSVPNTNLCIGRDGSYTEYYFGGTLQEVAVYNSALTATQVLAHYNAGLSNTSSQLLSFSETSVAVPATTTTPFDIFGYSNAGTLALQAVNWTNDTTRATALTTFSGLLVKSGDASYRYLGTGRTTGSSGQTEDSVNKRFLWNYCNRVPRKLLAVSATDNWSYTTATWRAANGDATSGVTRVEFVLGQQMEPLKLQVFLPQLSNSSDQYGASLGIGINSTTSNSADVYGAVAGTTAMTTEARYTGYPAVGYSYGQWLEISVATGTATWYGTKSSSGTQRQAGLMGEIWN